MYLITILLIMLSNTYTQEIIDPTSNIIEDPEIENQNTNIEDMCSTCILFPDTCPEECNNEVSSTSQPSDCIEQWVCSEWEECINGVQRRYCVDNNKCGTTNNKPEEERACEIRKEEITDLKESNERSLSEEEAEAPRRSNLLLILGTVFFGLIFVLSIIGLIYYLLKTIKNSGKEENIMLKQEAGKDKELLYNEINENSTQDRSPEMTELENWILNAINSGYSDDMIVSILVQYGWNRDRIIEIINKIRTQNNL